MKHLNLSPDDRLAEIGGGTGEEAHLIWKMAGTRQFSKEKPTLENKLVQPPFLDKILAQESIGEVLCRSESVDSLCGADMQYMQY